MGITVLGHGAAPQMASAASGGVGRRPSSSAVIGAPRTPRYLSLGLAASAGCSLVISWFS